MIFSDFGHKMNQEAGILQLMDDLGRALDDSPPKAMFGGGNPAQISEITKVYTDKLTSLLKDPARASSMLGNYDSPKGNSGFISVVSNFLNRHYNLGITEANIAITPGSQTGFFMLFNIIAGRSGGRKRKILFPIVPEYIGYADQGLEADMFESVRPKIEKISDHEFKYHVDFDKLNLNQDIAAVCLSRPTNPSGNVIDDSELEALAGLCEKNNTLLIIDNAYGQPFPGVIKNTKGLFWRDNIVQSMSLSKVGLPTSRVGIFVARPEIVKAISSANAIVSLASPSIGQYIAKPLIEDDTIVNLCDEYIKPFYNRRRQKMSALIRKHFPDNLPWRMHSYEGSYFFWLWCEGSNWNSTQMYNWLKTKGVLVVPGSYFFPGQNSLDYAHAHECLRINFSRPDSELEYGVPVLAEMIRLAYA